MEQANLPPVYREPLEKLQEAVEVGRYTVEEVDLYAQAYLEHLKQEQP